MLPAIPLGLSRGAPGPLWRGRVGHAPSGGERGGRRTPDGARSGGDRQGGAPGRWSAHAGDSGDYGCEPTSVYALVAAYPRTSTWIVPGALSVTLQVSLLLAWYGRQS